MPHERVFMDGRDINTILVMIFVLSLSGDFRAAISVYGSCYSVNFECEEVDKRASFPFQSVMTRVFFKRFFLPSEWPTVTIRDETTHYSSAS